MSTVDCNLQIVKDQMGRMVRLNHPPKKIISLVPSVSELVWDLGLRNELVGITKFCVNPEKMFRSKKRVGGTKQIRIDAIRKLNPDLILANKEENTKEMVDSLERDFPVFITDVTNYHNALEMIKLVGYICGKQVEANKIIHEVDIKYQKLSENKGGLSKSRKRVLYLIWMDPWMTIGRDTYIHQMLEIAGFENIYNRELRYPEITLKNAAELKPDLIFLSSEPYPFRGKHIELVKKAIPGSKVLPVDGEMFSWYGSRMLKSFDYFYNLQMQLAF